MHLLVLQNIYRFLEKQVIPRYFYCYLYIADTHKSC